MTKRRHGAKDKLLFRKEGLKELTPSRLRKALGRGEPTSGNGKPTDKDGSDGQPESSIVLSK